MLVRVIGYLPAKTSPPTPCDTTWTIWQHFILCDEIEFEDFFGRDWKLLLLLNRGRLESRSKEI